MTKDVARTNGDLVQPAVDRARRAAVELRDWALEHPDEACLAVAPAAAVIMATRRHDLTFAEALVLTEVGYWCGVLALKAYRDWKTRPAPKFPRLKAV